MPETADDSLADPREARVVPQLLKEAAARWGDRPFVIGAERILGFDTLHDEVRRLAAWLAAHGIGRGDRLALWMSNGPEWIVTQLATSWLGAVFVPVNPRLRKVDLADIVRRSGAKLLVTAAERRGDTDYAALAGELVDEGAIPGVRVALHGGSRADRPDFLAIPTQLEGEGIDAVEPAFDEPAYLLFTSGTTSAPKGVTLTYRSLGNAVKSRLHLRSGDVVSFEYPLAAITGCHNSVLGGLYAGTSLIVHDGSRPERSLELALQHRATVFAGHRLALRAFAERLGDRPAPPYEHAQVFPIDPADAWAYRRLGIRSIHGGYGMTETSGGVVVAQRTLDDALRAQASGKPAYGALVRVVGEDGRDVPVGAPGEIRVRGPQLMAGYWEDAEATAAAIDAGGWLHTGDLGRLEADGTLVFIERLADTYKCRGFTVSPGEVEDLLKGEPGVRDCVVAGVADAEEGAYGVAFVLAIEGASPDPERLRERAKEGLASFKVPRAVRIVAEIPRTLTGKPKRRELAASYLAAAKSQAACEELAL